MRRALLCLATLWHLREVAGADALDRNRTTSAHFRRYLRGDAGDVAPRARRVPRPLSPGNSVAAPGPGATAAGPWSFLVVADPHEFTYLAKYDGATDDYTGEEEWQSGAALWRGVREARGGDLVLLVGDTTSFGKPNNLEIAQINGYTEPSREATYVASRNAARGTRAFFTAVGYPTILSTVGDHEIGGNNWFMNGCATCKTGKYYVVPDYRRGFAEGFNTDADGAFLFREDIGGVPASPGGTEFNETSFAYVHKNALFVTIDAFRILPEEYIDRELGYGGEGGITVNVTGAHLEWFEQVLQVADDDPTIKHKFVQSHIPILHPVRKVRTSGQFMDGAEKSDFWKVMNKYNVDIYFAGDVHSSTASVSTLPGEDVVQVITSANKFVGYANLVVTEDVIDMTLYHDVGGRFNVTGNYRTIGRLSIDKSDSPARVTSEGELALIDPNSAILKFEFEEIFPLNYRGVLGLGASWGSTLQCPNGCVTIRDITCTQSVLNRGSFGSQYDAQVANIDLVPGPSDGQLAAEFTTDSIFAIYGVGPYTGGVPVSFSLWIKTAVAAAGEMVLVHYGSPYSARGLDFRKKKTHMTLTLKDGALVLHLDPEYRLGTVKAPDVNDGNWHRIGVSMPRQSCLLSEFEIYVDGQRVPTALLHAEGDDIHIFHMTLGRMALGGFGSTAADYDELYPLLRPFVGLASGFSLWSKPLPPSEATGSPVSAPTAQAPSLLPSPSSSSSESTPSNSPSQLQSPATKSLVPAPNAHYVVCGKGSGYCGKGAATLAVDAPSAASSHSLPAGSPLAQSAAPSTSPSTLPTGSPRTVPSHLPSAMPSMAPSAAPSDSPSSLPSVSPSAYSEFWLSCGKGTGCAEGNELPAGAAEEHQVRCCADTELPGWKKRGNCTVWASSLDPGCHMTSFATANELCEDAGGRLCTGTELATQCTRGSGCSFDSHLIWSSSPVVYALVDMPSMAPSAAPSDSSSLLNGSPSTYSEFWLVCGKGTGCPEGNELQAGVAEEHQVRCCADTELPGWKKQGNCTVWASSLYPGCHTTSFATANELCEDAGGRLCTGTELAAQCTRGSGCSFDSHLIWSSSTMSSGWLTGIRSTAPLATSPSNLRSSLPSGSPTTAPSHSSSAVPSLAPSADPSYSPSSLPSGSPRTVPSHLITMGFVLGFTFTLLR